MDLVILSIQVALDSHVTVTGQYDVCLTQNLS